MTVSNENPVEEHVGYSRLVTSSSLAATHSQVDLVVASIENNIGIPPPLDEVEASSCPSNSIADRDGIQGTAPRMGEPGGSTIPTGSFGNEPRSDGGSSTSLSSTPVAATLAAGTGQGSPLGNDASSFSGLPSSLTSHSSPAARTITVTSAVIESSVESASFTARTSPALSGRVNGDSSRDVLSRSMSSRSRRSTSVTSMRPLVPAARGLGLPSLASQTMSARVLSEDTRGALSFSPSSTPLGLGMGDTYRRRISSRNSSSLQQNDQHPLPGYALRLPARQARSEGGRASVRRLAGGGRDSWRAPAVAYNAVERRTGRDTTALRAVSARLDAAATAIDAVEIGVRSASDSLDSLLQLLESRPGHSVTPRAAVGNRGSSLEMRSPAPGMVPEESHDSSDSQGAAREVEPAATSSVAQGTAVVSPGGPRISTASSSMAWEVLEDSSGEPSSDDTITSVSTPQTVVREGRANAGRTASGRAREGGGGSRAANMLRGELAAGSVLPHSQREAEEQAESDEYVACAQTTSVGIRDAIIEESKGEPSTMVDGTLTRTLSPRRPLSSSVGRDIVEELPSSRITEGRESSRRHGFGSLTNSRRYGGRADESTSTTRVGSRTLSGSGTSEDATVGSEVSALPGDAESTSNDGPRSSQATEERRSPPRGLVTADSAVILIENEVNREADSDPSDVSLPVRELEAAMDGIDTERGRLIIEIARLRGQQNQSLVHLQRLQNEQFVVRQRQVSTLSDIVNSFGRTVAAAGALPHGENSSLGRISSDVVSTLRRMLRLLSATVPAAIAASPSSSTVDSLPLPTTASTSPDMLASPRSSSPYPVTDAGESSAAHGAIGTLSVGGQLALRPTGVDLTQEVIDAALQALPRLAAAATAISGARRMQGYLAGLTGDAEGRSSGTGRSCSTETIAALPDAPSSTWDGVGEVDGGRGCVICLSEGSTPAQSLCSLPCEHVFHRVCVGKWLRMQDSCPTCRRQVSAVENGSANPFLST